MWFFKFKLRLKITVGLLLLTVLSYSGLHAQNDMINKVRAAIKTGNSKELSQFFDSMVGLNFDGEKSSYSKSQAEFVLKDFFKKNPPTDFQIIHQGVSKNKSFNYVMGEYKVSGGTFRIYILIKQKNDTFFVDTMDFTRE